MIHRHELDELDVGCSVRGDVFAAYVGGGGLAIGRCCGAAAPVSGVGVATVG